ncbi:hypothetical protein M9H77_18660 [Catharanthus roseus]|uniref:Uncharacterized protein n=1 Tax=Catharanthus roseus TaxID=4058 RepID=A0ACC0B810_CATRO|nr:hypothetical protein M9H77_18660 [Catharanthus roseus]
MRDTWGDTVHGVRSLRRFMICGEESFRKDVYGTWPYLSQRSGMFERTGQQAILIEKFLKSKELEELHKYQLGEKGVCERFHEAKWKFEEKATVMGTTVLDDLALMVIVVRGVRQGCVYGAGSEAIHLRAESSRAPSCRGLAPIESCCADMLRRVEAAILSNYLVYIPPLPMLDLVRAAMGTSASKSSPLAAIVNSEAPIPSSDSKAPALDVAVRSSSTPSPSILTKIPMKLLSVLRPFGSKNTDKNLSIGNFCWYSLPKNITT